MAVKSRNKAIRFFKPTRTILLRMVHRGVTPPGSGPGQPLPEGGVLFMVQDLPKGHAEQQLTFNQATVW